MKFEIDDETGIIQHEDSVMFDPAGLTMTTICKAKKSFVKLEKEFDIHSMIESSRQTSKDSISSEELEQIHKAVKKTQKKRTNVKHSMENET